jgi:hypothetical protein
MSEDHKARIREFLDRVLTRGEINATDDYFHRDVVEEVSFPGQGPGLDGLKATLIHFRRAFPDAQWRVEDKLRRTIASSPALSGQGRIMASS